jgi:aminopeptidase N
MSSYLLAFVIGKFDHIELSTRGEVRVRAYTKKGHSYDSFEHTKIAAEAIDMYEDYFKINYPLPKLDLVAYHKM